MTADSPVCNNLQLNVVDTSLQNKTVECQLEEIVEKIAATEANIYLFRTLIGLGLATNDVKNFISKQIIHKRVAKNPDLKVQRMAMRSKLVDACAFVKRLRQLRDKLKGKVARKYSSRKSLGRRVLDRVACKYKRLREKEISDCQAKIEHIKHKNEMDKILKSVPNCTEDLLSEVNIFDPNQTSVEPEKSDEPFICDSSIKLDENERAILAKGPKFMLREELDINDFNLELETMVAKKKYDSMFRSEDDCESHTDSGKTSGSESEQLCSDEHKELNFNGKKSEKSKDVIWEENSNRMLYNLKTKTLNLANMQATSYKHNKEVFLPKPESPKKETSHEFRKREMLSLFNRANKSISKGNSGSNPNSNSNLSVAEAKGLKSLKKRIANGELMVVDTDKSKKFAILSQKQYIESGKVHTDKDVEIEPHLIKKIQRSVNNHSWWAKEIFQCGYNWGHSQRMSTNLEDSGDQVCSMTLLVKDHKQWSPGSEGPPPSRPVVSGNNGLNCHLSELISAVIEPIAYEETGNEVDSTDDMLARIKEINEKIKSLNESVCCEEAVQEMNEPDSTSNE